MSFDEACVCEVFAPGADAPGSFGSGYLVRQDLVLTARHVVDRAAGPCEVRLLGRSDWLGVEGGVAWRGESTDVALLRIPAQEIAASARLGRIAGGRRVPCRAVGFPLAQERGRVRDTEEIEGEIAPLAARKKGVLTVHIAGSVPSAGDAGDSPWEGMSGAALFCDDLLVGVLTVDPASFGTDRLTATPITEPAADEAFRAALGGVPGPSLLPALEDEPARALLTPPYNPLPRKATAEFFRRSPVHLCLPAFGIVPFTGRRAELSDLGAWCDGDGFEIALLLGGGGSGKTRLAAELSYARADDGWVTGFLERGSDSGALTEVASPLLVVLDEADARLAEVAGLAGKLSRDRDGVPTRLLLVARQGGEWWERLLPQRLEDDVEAQVALGESLVCELGAFEEGPAARATAYAAALQAFAARQERSADGLEAPRLDREPFDRVLFILLAALTALEREPVPADVPVQAGLLAARLRHEGAHWEATARQAGLEAVDERVRERAVALATLTAADGESEAAALLDAVPDLAGEAQEPLRRRVAAWLHTLYPGAGWLRPLEPDLLGEALVADVLAELPELAGRLLARSSPAQARRTLMVLTRTANAHEPVEAVLRDALAEQVDVLWEPAIEVAQTTGDPIGLLLAEVLSANPRPDLSAEIRRRLPHDTVALRELAAVVTRTALEDVRQRPEDEERSVEEAQLLRAQSFRYGELGHPEAALEAAERSVQIWRRLAEARPGRYVVELAMSLSDLSGRLAEVRSFPRSLALVEESVDLFRALEEANPGMFRSFLALALSNLSARLAEVDRAEDALAAIGESVALYRAAAEEDGDESRAELARALRNQGAHLQNEGNSAEALAPLEEAVTIRRALADTSPDAFRPILAGSLSALATCLADLDRGEEALRASDEAVRIQTELAAARPDAFLRDLLRSVDARVYVLESVQRPEEARATAEEALRRVASLLQGASLPQLTEYVPYIAFDTGTLLGRYERLSSSTGAEADAALIQQVRDLLRWAGVGLERGE